MIKTALAIGTMAVGLAFAAGWYAGWKTTLRLFDEVSLKKRS